MKKIISTVLAVIMLFSLAALVGCAGCNEPMPEFETVNETVYATASVRVRSTPSVDTDDNIVVTLTKGQAIVRTGYNEEWSRVLYEGEVCYISSRYLTTEKPSDYVEPSTTGGNNTNDDETVPDEDFTACDNEVLYVAWKQDGVWLKSGTVNIYSEANFSAKDGVLNIGTKVTRVAVYYETEGEITGLSKILVGDKTCYISNRALSEIDYTALEDTTN